MGVITCRHLALPYHEIQLEENTNRHRVYRTREPTKSWNMLLFYVKPVKLSRCAAIYLYRNIDHKALGLRL